MPGQPCTERGPCILQEAQCAAPSLMPSTISPLSLSPPQDLGQVQRTCILWHLAADQHPLAGGWPAGDVPVVSLQPKRRQPAVRVSNNTLLDAGNVVWLRGAWQQGDARGASCAG